MEATASRTPVVIGLDLGNSRMKTAHHNFIAGLSASNTRPIGLDSIKYKDMFYEGCAFRRNRKDDKASDEDYYLLSLLAICRELESRGELVYEREVPIHLGIALTLEDIREEAKRIAMRQYFKLVHPNPAKFLYNGREVILKFKKVNTYPQGVIGLDSVMGQLVEEAEAYMVDIGGGTINVARLFNGQLDGSEHNIHTLECGMNDLCEEVAKTMKRRYNYRPTESQLDQLLLKHNGGELPEELQNAIFGAVEQVVKDAIFGGLSKRRIDLRYKSVCFMGGGAVALEPFLRKYAPDSKLFFILDPQATAKGIEKIMRPV